jgi:dihydrofolate reductase
MKITILMALSLNGFIARPDGDEEFLSEKGWDIMQGYIKEYNNLVWGRKTYETVLGWGEEYEKYLESVNLVVVSSKEKTTNTSTVYCQSPKEALEYFQNKGMDKVLVSGGATLNTSFVKEGLADELILTYNPVIIPNGINLFGSDIVDLNLKLKDVKIIEDLVHVKYEILK